ncbi:HNH endonuclease signature motif containing protein [Enterobacter asburiae]|uniref:HNH endonuclease signature motif containing protein n=1 Tax=Enterobacter asburiae TaxID=61645 RepID=UPI00192A8FE2|nr:HNH endonuclease signature motif containing protein [Enterobacter asburiae]MBL5926505.1 HNH endonuclease [Enterobacter asburiae]MBL5957291.1 HNH endonuclease [Enterobacter asburiae]
MKSLKDDIHGLYGVVHWTECQKPRVYAVPEDFYDANPSFPLLNLASMQRMKIGDTRKITRSIDDQTHHLWFIKREVAFPFPDVPIIDRLSQGIVTHPEKPAYDIYFDFPAGLRLRRHFCGACIAQAGMDNVDITRQQSHLTELARDLLMGRRNFKSVLEPDPTAGNERFLLHLPDNGRVNPPSNENIGISKDRLHGIAASPQRREYDRLFSQPGGDVLRGVLIQIPGQALKAARLQLLTRLLSGETTFKIRAAWLPEHFRDRVIPVTDGETPSAPSPDKPHEKPEQKTVLPIGYWIELPENFPHSIGDGRLDRYTVDDMIKHPEKDTFDEYFRQMNGEQLRQYLIAGAQIMPYAGKQIQKLKKQLRLVANALVKGETRIFLQKWSQYDAATSDVKFETSSALSIVAKEPEVGPSPNLNVVFPLQGSSAIEQPLWRELIANSAALKERSASHAEIAAREDAEQRHARISAICNLSEVKEAISATKMDDFRSYLDRRLQKNPHIGTPPVAEYLAWCAPQHDNVINPKSANKPVVSLLVPDTTPSLANVIIARERRQVMTLQRDMRAHNQFKALVWENFGRCCAVTRKHWLGELDAAHIEDAVHGCFSVSNGLLLSPTLHRLFGRFKMSIDPESMTVHFLPDSGFEEFEGAPIAPIKWSLDKQKLAVHWQIFLQRRG